MTISPLRLTGLIPATYTPVAPDGSLALSMIDRLAEHHVRDGAGGVFVGGTTGEAGSFTIDERIAVVKRWGEAATSSLSVMVHVDAPSLAAARVLAETAVQSGARAISACAPSFFRPGDAMELARWCAAITEVAPQLPFYFYDIPAMTGVDVSTYAFVERAVEMIPTFTGIKFSRPDYWELQRCLRRTDLEILFGCDECLVAGLALGCRAAIGSTYNYAAPISQAVIAAWNAGDFAKARAVQLETVALVEELVEFGVVRSGKLAMRRFGLDCGPVRAPLTPFTSEEEDVVLERLRRFVTPTSSR